MKRSEAVDQLKQTWAILNADLDAAVAYGRTQNTPYAQRALVRAFFAAVEGLSFQMRQVTLASLAGTNLITEQELYLLREVRHSLDDKGRPTESRSYLAFPESMLFSLAVYAKNHGASFEVDKSKSGWRSFKRSIDVRNNVTHPKTPESLSLTNEDLQALTDASSWWHSTLLELFKACDEADEFWRSRLEEGE